MPRIKAKALQVVWPTYPAMTINWGRVVGAIALIFCLSTVTSLAQGQTWERGKLVGLSAGTCIREGPGFTYRAHTRVPEDSWTVMIIGGPRTADGLTWWDTSRKAAGDPSGGTGWVTQAQTDTNCDYVTTPAQPANPTAINPPNTPFISPSLPVSGQDLLEQIKTWWFQQAALTKWVVAVLSLLLLSTLWRFVGGVVMEFIGAVFLALVIWVFLNLTRAFWQEVWTSLAGAIFGGDVPDLALLLSVLPLVSWGFSLILRSIRIRM